MALEDIMSTERVAREIGLSPDSVRRLCNQHKIGQIVAGTRLLTPSDVLTIIRVRRPMGRPRKTEPSVA